jgi:hypothetical protein
MVSFKETMVTSTVEPNPCPTAPHGSHTSGVSYFALLELVCQQRRSQAQCSGSGNVLGKGLQGEGTAPANCTRLLCLQRFIPGLQCINYWERSSLCSRFSFRCRCPRWSRELCERGGRTMRARFLLLTAGSGSSNLTQWLDCTGTETLGERGKGKKFLDTTSMSHKRRLALLCCFCRLL